MKTAAVIQARMSSSRLPGKVLLDIGGRPMLQWVVERSRRAARLDAVVVATTTDPSDDPVAAFCQAQDIPCVRGSLHDVLDRYAQTVRQVGADIVVRITADCPLIDPGLIDRAASVLGSATGAAGGLDFAANRLPPPWGRTTPIGLDVEVVTRQALETAWEQARGKHYREHVMPYFYDDLAPDAFHIEGGSPAPGWRLQTARTPRGFQIGLLQHQPDFSQHRWTVDTAADLGLVRKLVERLPGTDFTWQDILAVVQQEPELAQMNAHVPHRTAHDVDERG
jgi:spore coat polysaccharide biosynthesis protein SpsF